MRKEIHNGTYYVIMVKHNNTHYYVSKNGSLILDKYKARTWKLMSGAEKNLDKISKEYKNAFISER